MKITSFFLLSQYPSVLIFMIITRYQVGWMGHIFKYVHIHTCIYSKRRGGCMLVTINLCSYSYLLVTRGYRRGSSEFVNMPVDSGGWVADHILIPI